MRLFRWIGAWRRDFGYAFRAVRSRPVVALLAVVTITLGIGVSTAIFSIINAILLQPPPYKNPDSLVMVWNLNERDGYTHEDTKSRGQSMSPAEFLEWKNESNIFGQMVAFGPRLVTITETDDPEMTHGYHLTEGGFGMLGVQPMLGRLPTPEEEQDPEAAVILLRHNLWQRRFHSDPNVIDQTVKFYGQEQRIIGVLPPDFVFFNRQSEFLAPMAFNERMTQMRSFRGFRVMARLKEGMTIEEAQARADQFSREMEQRHPDTNTNWHVSLYSIADDTVGELQQAMKVLLAAVGFVLLIMCVNVANLLLVQASARTRELAVRSALGAGRWRLVRQLLGESLLLSMAGGVLGLGLAFGLVRYFQAMVPDRYTHGKYLPQLEAIGISWPVVLFAFAVALLTGLIFGLIPAVRASKPNFNEDLKDSARGSGGGLRTRGLRSALVVAEVAVGLILVIGAALLVRSFAALYANGPGLQSRGLLTLIVTFSFAELRQEAEERGLSGQEGFQYMRSRLVALNDKLFGDLATVPGIEGAAGTSNLPMQGWFSPSEFSIEGRPLQSAQDAPQALGKVVTPNYFQTMGIPLLRGRTFEDLDLRDSQRVAVIGDQLAELYFPNEDPIGKRIKRGGPDSRDEWAVVVGVVGSIREAGMDKPAVPAYYISQTQQPLSFMYLVLKTDGNATAVLPDVRRVVDGVQAGIPIYRVREMDDIVRDSAWQLNYSMMLLSGLAALALLLAVVGVYGVLSHAVRERTQEIGVRVALGADRTSVLGLVLRHGMVLIAVGAALGFVGAAGLTRFLSALLFGVESLDWPTFGVSAVALLGIGAVASYFPARRATRIEPIEALRHE